MNTSKDSGPARSSRLPMSSEKTNSEQRPISIKNSKEIANPGAKAPWRLKITEEKLKEMFHITNRMFLSSNEKAEYFYDKMKILLEIQEENDSEAKNPSTNIAVEALRVTKQFFPNWRLDPDDFDGFKSPLQKQEKMRPVVLETHQLPSEELVPPENDELQTSSQQGPILQRMKRPQTPREGQFPGIQKKPRQPPILHPSLAGRPIPRGFFAPAPRVQVPSVDVIRSQQNALLSQKNAGNPPVPGPKPNIIPNAFNQQKQKSLDESAVHNTSPLCNTNISSSAAPSSVPILPASQQGHTENGINGPVSWTNHLNPEDVACFANGGVQPDEVSLLLKFSSSTTEVGDSVEAPRPPSTPRGEVQESEDLLNAYLAVGCKSFEGVDDKMDGYVEELKMTDGDRNHDDVIPLVAGETNDNFHQFFNDIFKDSDEAWAKEQSSQDVEMNCQQSDSVSCFSIDMEALKTDDPFLKAYLEEG